MPQGSSGQDPRLTVGIRCQGSAGHFGLDSSGGDGIHLDPVRAQFDREGADGTVNRGFCYEIGTDLRDAEEGGHRTDEDNAPGTLFAHAG